MYVEDVLKQLGVEGKVEASDVSTAKSANADLILCSPHLAGNLSGSTAPVRTVQNFVNREEIRQVLLDFLGGR